MWDQSGIYSLDAMSGIHNAKTCFIRDVSSLRFLRHDSLYFRIVIPFN